MLIFGGCFLHYNEVRVLKQTVSLGASKMIVAPLKSFPESGMQT